jgi:phage-related holin
MLLFDIVNLIMMMICNVTSQLGEAWTFCYTYFHTIKDTKSSWINLGNRIMILTVISLTVSKDNILFSSCQTKECLTFWPFNLHSYEFQTVLRVQIGFIKLCYDFVLSITEEHNLSKCTSAIWCIKIGSTHMYPHVPIFRQSFNRWPVNRHQTSILLQNSSVQQNMNLHL